LARRQREQRQQAARRALQREDRRARQQAKKRFRRWTYLGASGVIAILVIVSMGLSSMMRPQQRTGFSRGEGPGEVVSQIPATQLADGTTYGDYNSIPPTSGPHWEQVADWGIHTEPIPNELQVHNLKYGGVAIQYKTEDTELIAQLEEFAEKQPDSPCYLLVAPYPDMDATIALTAWAVRDTMEAYDETSLQAFVDAYRNQGPERVSCEL